MSLGTNTRQESMKTVQNHPKSSKNTNMTLHVSYQNFAIAGSHTTFRYARTKYSPRSPRIWHLFSEIRKSFFTRVQRKSVISGIFGISDVAHPTMSGIRLRARYFPTRYSEYPNHHDYLVIVLVLSCPSFLKVTCSGDNPAL